MVTIRGKLQRSQRQKRFNRSNKRRHGIMKLNFTVGYTQTTAGLYSTFRRIMAIYSARRGIDCFAACIQGSHKKTIHNIEAIQYNTMQYNRIGDHIAQ